MIAVLPPRVPGESYESLVARVARRVHPGQTRNPLLTRHRGRTSPAVTPKELVDMLAVPQWLPLSDIIEEHTVFPVLRPFLDMEEAKRQEVRLANGLLAATIAEVTATDSRFCPKCRVEELLPLPEVGRHWIHQFFWICRCHKHRCALRVDVRQGSSRQTSDGVPLDTCCITSKADRFLRQVEQDTIWLSKARLPPLGRVNWRALHRKLLIERFGISPSMPRRDLYEIALQIPSSARKWLRLNYSSYCDHWIEATVGRSEGVTHPLNHLCLLRLCRVAVKEAVEALRNCTPEVSRPTQLMLFLQ